jgi:hypothetical protein
VCFYLSSCKQLWHRCSSKYISHTYSSTEASACHATEHAFVYKTLLYQQSYVASCVPAYLRHIWSEDCAAAACLVGPEAWCVDWVTPHDVTGCEVLAAACRDQ